MGGSSTTVQKSDPWAAVQPHLKELADESLGLYRKGAFAPDPYSGPRVAGFGEDTQSYFGNIRNMAQTGDPLVSQSRGFLGDMMSGDYQSDALERVKRGALGSAIPAATSMFSGSGMANSTQAMDAVGRAATEAVAPYEYGAHEAAMRRGMQAAGLAPMMQQAAMASTEALGRIGQRQDIMSQLGVDADMARYYEGAGQEAANLANLAGIVTPLGGMGGTSSSTSSQSPGIGQILGTGLGLLAFLSDRRAKSDIVRIGATIGGTSLYAFKYKGSETVHVGVMADEVPHAVAGQVLGFDVVDYARVH